MNSLIQGSVNQAQSYMDLASLSSLKRESVKNTREGLEQVAVQFEAVFLNMALKSMRDANEAFAKDSYFDSQQSRMYRDMLDNQLSLTLSQGKGIGLAETLVRQMGDYLPAENAGQGKVTEPGSLVDVGV